jgi:hypothetical protein
LTLGWPFRTRDTVPTDTPAVRARSLIVNGNGEIRGEPVHRLCANIIIPDNSRKIKIKGFTTLPSEPIIIGGLSEQVNRFNNYGESDRVTPEA